MQQLTDKDKQLLSALALGAAACLCLSFVFCELCGSRRRGHARLASA